MKSDINIKERKPIWIVLSDFYLDTELEDSGFKCIASKIKDSPYTLQQVKEIDKEEVFPILYHNLLSVAGVWTGFQEEWLIAEITRKLGRRNYINRIVNTTKYVFFKTRRKAFWERIESELKNTQV